MTRHCFTMLTSSTTGFGTWDPSLHKNMHRGPGPVKKIVIRAPSVLLHSCFHSSLTKLLRTSSSSWTEPAAQPSIISIQEKTAVLLYQSYLVLYKNVISVILIWKPKKTAMSSVCVFTKKIYIEWTFWQYHN